MGADRAFSVWGRLQEGRRRYAGHMGQCGWPGNRAEQLKGRVIKFTTVVTVSPEPFLG